jgi:hypothetical protein
MHGPAKVVVSEKTAQRSSDRQVWFDPLGAVELKGVAKSLLLHRHKHAGGRAVSYSTPSLIGASVLITSVGLLFTTRYPPGLFDLVVGIDRWGYR